MPRGVRSSGQLRAAQPHASVPHFYNFEQFKKFARKDQDQDLAFVLEIMTRWCGEIVVLSNKMRAKGEPKGRIKRGIMEFLRRNLRAAMGQNKYDKQKDRRWTMQIMNGIRCPDDHKERKYLKK